jgi:antitoxin component HigA of HigAB toxin-antitoxin module
MSGKPSPSASWCFLRHNVVLRDLIRIKMERENLNIKDLADRIGFAPYRIGRYLLFRKQGLTQYQLVALCKELGIKLDLTIGLND